MSLTVLDSLEDLPEQYHAEYERGEDGKFYLTEALNKARQQRQESGGGRHDENDKGRAADDYKELRESVDAARKDARDWKQKARQQEQTWEPISRHGTPDEIEAKLDHLAEMEQRNLEKKGEWEKLREQMREQTASELAKKDEVIAGLRQRLDTEIRGRQVAEAISKAEGNPALLKPILMQKTKLVGDVEAGEELRVEILEGDQPLVDADGNMLTVEGYVKRLRDDESYAGAFKGTGNSGGGSGGEGRQGGAGMEGSRDRRGGGMPPELASLRRSQMTPRQKIDVQNALAEQNNGDREAALSAYLQIPE